jgi:hypothetical protein
MAKLSAAANGLTMAPNGIDMVTVRPINAQNAWLRGAVACCDSRKAASCDHRPSQLKRRETAQRDNLAQRVQRFANLRRLEEEALASQCSIASTVSESARHGAHNVAQRPLGKHQPSAARTIVADSIASIIERHHREQGVATLAVGLERRAESNANVHVVGQRLHCC